MHTESGRIGRTGLVAALDQAADGIMITDTEGTIQYVNPAFTLLTGYSSEEAVGRSSRLLESGLNAKQFYEDLWATIQSGNVWQGELVNRRKDGTLYHEEMRIAPVRLPQGKVVHYIATKHNVDERKAAAEDKALLAAIVEASEDAIIAFALDGTIRAWNRGAEMVFGYAQDEAIGRDIAMIVPTARHPQLRELIKDVSLGRRRPRYDGFGRCSDGRVIPVSVTGSPIKAADGQVTAVSLHLHDISVEKLAQEKLRQSEELFRKVFENAPFGMVVSGLDGRISRVNSTFCRMLGYNEAELLGAYWAELTHPDDSSVSQRLAEQLCREPDKKIEGERRCVSRSGAILWTRIEITRMPEGDSKSFCHVIRIEDITERKRAALAVQEARNFAKSTIDALASHICVLDETGTIIAVNQAWRNFAIANGTGQIAGHMGGSPACYHFGEGVNYLEACDRAFGPAAEDAAEFAAGIRAVMRGELEQFSKEYCCHSSGKELWFMSRVTRFFVHQLPRIVVEHVNITERKLAEQAAHSAKLAAEAEAAEREFHSSLIGAIHDVSPDGILVVGGEGEVISFNRRFLDVWRIVPPAGDAAGDGAAAVCPSPEVLLAATRAAIVTGADAEDRDLPTAAGAEIALDDGRTLERHSATLRTSNGGHRGRVWFFRDITERKRAEAALRESEERFRTMADGCPAAMWMTNAEGGKEFINRAYRELFGTTLEALAEDRWHALLHPEDAPGYMEAFRRAQRERSSFRAEARVRRADGVWRWVESYAEPRISAQGELLGHVGLSPDITERKEAEQRLIESEEKFRQLAENIREVFWVVRPNDHETQYVSPAYEQVWGRSRQSFYDEPQSWFDAIHSDDRKLVKPLLDRNIPGDSISLEYRIRTPEGEEKWIRDRAFPIRNRKGELSRIVGIAEDITEQKHYEEALIRAREAADAASRQLSQQHAILDGERKILRTFIDNVPDLMFVKDRESRFVVANREIARWAGVERAEDLLGKDDFQFFPKELAARYLEDDRRVMESGEPLFDREERMVAPSRDEARYLLTTKVPLFDADGRVIGIAGIGRNITERKKGEDAVRETNRRLQEATTMANALALEAAAANRAKSRFLANMSHEIRTPMNGIVGMNQLLLETALTPEQTKYVEVAQKCGHTLLALIDNVLDLSKIEAGKITLEKSSLDIRQMVSELVVLMQTQATEKGLEIRSEVSEQVPVVLKGDALRLRQILTNLTANAVKFTERGEVSIAVEVMTEGKGAAILRFAVADTGIGIASDQIPLLFSPFVQADASTTRKYGGTGLGLTISKQLVEMMGGKIGVKSRMGQGSTFWFTAVLESADPGEQATPPEGQESQAAGQALPMPRGCGERILVAEDNPTNQFVVLAQLEKLGYMAEAVSNGAEAVEAIERGGFDLVLMDCEMPVMDGYEATRRIRTSRSAAVPVIALTAHAMSSIRERCLGVGMNDYLAKPLELPRLAEVLERWIETGRRPSQAVISSKPARNAEAGIFDEERLLGRLMGDADLADKILAGFIENAPVQIETIRKQVSEQDAVGLRLQTHSLKGAAATVEAARLSKIALDMEEAARIKDYKRCAELLAPVEEEFRRFKCKVGKRRAAGVRAEKEVPKNDRSQ